MRWCIKMTNIRLGERNNFLRECVCSLKVYAAARSFHSVPCFSRRQPSFYGLFVFIPNLPITVSPLSNFSDKTPHQAECLDAYRQNSLQRHPGTMFFGVFRKIRKYWTWLAGRKWVLAEKLCVEGRRLWDNGDKKFGCQFLWTQPFPFCEFSPLFFVWLYIIKPLLTLISLSLVFPFGSSIFVLTW